MGVVAAALPVVLLGFAVSVVTELLGWALVYRTGSYRRLKDELDRASKKLEAIKQGSSSAVAIAKPNKSNKKEKKLEENMKTSSRDMMASRFKLNMITSVAMIVVYNVLMSRWDGIVMAKLPFSPPGLMQTFTHRGLIGDDPTDCSALFIFAMSLSYFKLNMAKLAPWSLSRAATRAMAPGNTMNMDKYK